MSKDLGKVYKNLKPEQLADVFMAGLASRDFEEAERIAESYVPRETYVSLHKDFLARMNLINNIGLQYGITLWRTTTKIQSLKPETEQEEIYYLFDMLASLEQALSEICTELNINIDSIRFLSHTEHIPNNLLQSKFNPLPDWTEFYKKLLTGNSKYGVH